MPTRRRGPDDDSLRDPRRGRANNLLDRAADSHGTGDDRRHDAVRFPGTPIIELNGAEAGQGVNGLILNAADSVDPRPHHQPLSRQRHRAAGRQQQYRLRQLDRDQLHRHGSGRERKRHPDHVIGQPHRRLDGWRAKRHLGQHDRREHRLDVRPRQHNRRQLHRDGRAGTADVGNTQTGVLVLGEANVIGGPGAGNRNVISGNDLFGAQLGEGANANTVQGNIIGTDALGTGAIPNGIGVSVGISVDSGASTNTLVVSTRARGTSSRSTRGSA